MSSGSSFSSGYYKKVCKDVLLMSDEGCVGSGCYCNGKGGRCGSRGRRGGGNYRNGCSSDCRSKKSNYCYFQGERCDNEIMKGFESDSDGDPDSKALSKTKRILINVGGTKFLTYRQTLNRYPTTRLATLVRSIPDKNKFFFDRSPDIFGYILDYYRTSELHLPQWICRDKLKEDLGYWGIEHRVICEVCMREVFINQEEEEFNNNSLEKEFNWQVQIDINPKSCRSCQYKLFQFLDNPSSSSWAFLYGAFVLLCIFLSLVTFISRTMTTFLVERSGENTTAIIERAVQSDHRIIGNDKAKYLLTHELNPYLLGIDYLTVSVITLDLICRFFVCPDKFAFVSCFINIIDILATIPMAITVLLRVAFQQTLRENINVAIIYALLDSVKLLRTCRVFRFTSRYSSLRVLVISLRKSVNEMILLLVFVCTGMVLFSTCAYYSEFWQSQSKFVSIPQGFWWAVVTMTTVGYGDMHPTSGWGYLVGGLCSLAGIVFLALPIPIIGNNFGVYYTYALSKNRKEAMEKSKQVATLKKFGGGFGRFGGGGNVHSIEGVENETNQGPSRRKKSAVDRRDRARKIERKKSKYVNVHTDDEDESGLAANREHNRISSVPH